MAIEDSVVSIWQGEVNKSDKAKGSGFCIAPKLVMTAEHVVRGVNKKDLYIGLTNNKSDAGLRVREVHLIAGYDAAILELYEEHGNQILGCDFTMELQTGLKVELIAYNVIQKKHRGPLEKQIANGVKDDQHWEFDTYPAKGMSGGAVLYNNKVIGIIRARNKEGNSGLLIPIHLFEQQIQQYLSNSNNQASQSHSVISTNQYLEKQVEKLASFFDDVDAKPFKQLCIHHYFSQCVDTSKVTSLMLAEAIRDDQQKIIHTNNLREMRKVAKLIASHLDKQDYDEQVSQRAKHLFALAMSLMLIKCPIKNDQLNEPKAHYVAVLDERTLELIAAQLYNMTPRLDASTTSHIAQGAGMLNINPIRQASWEDEQVADLAAQTAFEHILRGETYAKEKLSMLNCVLEDKQEDDEILYYCMVERSDKQVNELTNPDVVKALKADDRLPALPVFIVEGKVDKVISKLSATIYYFYQQLIKYQQKQTTKATP